MPDQPANPIPADAAGSAPSEPAAARPDASVQTDDAPASDEEAAAQLGDFA